MIFDRCLAGPMATPVPLHNIVSLLCEIEYPDAVPFAVSDEPSCDTIRKLYVEVVPYPLQFRWNVQRLSQLLPIVPEARQHVV